MGMMPETLDHQERGLQLVNRQSDPGHATEDPTPQAPGLDELAALKARIAALKAAHPKDAAPHCGACYHRGVEAALAALEE